MAFRMRVESREEGRAVLEGELKATRDQLRACELELERIRSRARDEEFKATSTRKALMRSEQLLDGWRAVARQLEAELMDGEEELLRAEMRAERLEDALTSIRGGRAYKVMRAVWRLRQPFRRG